MIRRRFLQFIAAAGAGSLASAVIVEAGETRTILFHVQGFTCITCAVGLEVLMQKVRGVSSASASYPDATITIKYHPALVNEESLRSHIAEMGFSATHAEKA